MLWLDFIVHFYFKFWSDFKLFNLVHLRSHFVFLNRREDGVIWGGYSSQLASRAGSFCPESDNYVRHRDTVVLISCPLFIYSCEKRKSKKSKVSVEVSLCTGRRLSRLMFPLITSSLSKIGKCQLKTKVRRSDTRLTLSQNLWPHVTCQYIYLLCELWDSPPVFKSQPYCMDTDDEEQSLTPSLPWLFSFRRF